MRFLIVSGGFAKPGDNPSLLNDLADSLSRRGHVVDVLVLEAKGSGGQTVESASVGSGAVYRLAPNEKANTIAQRILAHGRVSLASRSAERFLPDVQYDLCIFTSPGVFSWGVPRRLKRSGIAAKTLMVLWDFFPIHNREIGRIPSWVPQRALKLLERRSVQSADVVAVMSEANRRFLANYYPRLGVEAVIIPPWAASNGHERRSSEEPLGRFTAVFGGQLSRGRGVETIIDAASLLESRGWTGEILIAGGGPEATRLEEYSERLGLSSLRFLGRLPQDDLRLLLRRAHVGIAVTVPGVSVPTFPSKIVEYCSQGLPVIAALEDGTDAGDLLESRTAGIAIEAGRPDALANALSRFQELHEQAGLGLYVEGASKWYAEELNVNVVAGRIEDLAR